MGGRSRRSYISVLPREHTYSLADFVVHGCWEAVQGDPAREAVLACWADGQRATADPRQFVLMRPVGRRDPSRIYTGLFEETWSAGQIPWLHRRRWPDNELRIRDLIQGANLNVNYGYTYTQVPNRTRQREWEHAQERVVVTERQLADHQDAVHHLRQRLADLQNAYAAQRRQLERELVRQRLALRRRQRAGQTTLRAQKRVGGLRRQVTMHTQRFLSRQQHLLQQLADHQLHARQLHAGLRQRLAVRDAIDTQTLCRERDLEKDQIMLDGQILLANLHDWVVSSYLAPAWRHLSLEKATQMIYRKAGRVIWHTERIEVILEPYRYPDQQQAMEITCARFNAAAVHWRDGRLLHISVASPVKF